MRDDEARHPDCRIERLIERLVPLRVCRVDDVGALGCANVVDQDIDAAKRLESRVDDLLGAFGRGQVSCDVMV